MSDSSTTKKASLSWRLWQLLVIPICYPVFVFGSLIMIALIPIAAVLLPNRTRRTRWLRGALHRGAQLWVRFHELLGVLEVRVDDKRETCESSTRAPNSLSTNRSKQAPQAALLVIANHPSLIDVLLITAALPNLCCVLKGALHYNPLFTLLIRYLDYLPNSDPERMLAEGHKRLLAGEQLLIFPEGTRTEPNKPLKFRMGAAELAVRSSACVLPVAIRSNSLYLSKGVPWYRLPTGKLSYRLEIGPWLVPFPEVIDDTDSSEARKHRRSASRALNQTWRNHFAQRLPRLHVGN